MFGWWVALDAGSKLGIIGIVIAVAALMVAIPPFIQMIWGKAALKIDFDFTAEQGARILICRIFNPPIKSKILRGLGVTRTPTKAVAVFDICEHGPNRIIANGFRAHLVDVKSQTGALSMTAEEPHPLLFIVAEHRDNGATSTNYAPPQQTAIPLPVGEYFAQVRVGFHGGVVHAAKSFSIGAGKDATNWNDRPLPK